MAEIRAIIEKVKSINFNSKSNYQYIGTLFICLVFTKLLLLICINYFAENYILGEIVFDEKIRVEI